MEDKQFQIQDIVQWYEGQLLYPQHYQEMRHEIHQLALCHLSIARPWYWGVHHISIDENLLATGVLRVNELLAIMPDGSVLEKTGFSKEKTELDFSQSKEDCSNKPLTIYLAVLKRQADAANTANQPARYDSIESLPIIDENTGDGPITMPKLKLKAFLVMGENLSSQYSGFPLMRIKFSGNQFQRVDFIPPSTNIRQDTPIGHYVGNLLKNLRKRITFLGERLQIMLTQDTAAILDYYSRIYNVLTSRVVVIEALYFSQKVHPFEIYRELCIAAGTYCALQRGLIPPVFDPYNHDDLKATFDPVVNFIDRIVEMIKDPSLEVPFNKSGRIFERNVKKDWMTNDYIILGLKIGLDATSASIIHWLNGALIGSSSVIDKIKEKRILGSVRTPVEQVPEFGLISTSRQMLVKISIDPNFIRPDEVLQIFNPSDSENNRPEEIVLYIVG